MTPTRKPTGYILHETKSLAVIATEHSRNAKTGDMVQVWILHRWLSPMDAVRTGADSVICGDCPLRSPHGQGFEDRGCYVQVAKAPMTIWDAYRRGRYPLLRTEDYPKVFAGRAVRFGAYGDPVHIPGGIMRAITEVCARWTGYTHQWDKDRYHAYRRFLMASVETEGQRVRAREDGWRTFRLIRDVEAKMAWEVLCPASEEAGKRTQCAQCGLCDGKRGPDDGRADIAILPHGQTGVKQAAMEVLGLVQIHTKGRKELGQ